MKIGVLIDDVIIAGGVHLMLTGNHQYNSCLIANVDIELPHFSKNYDAIVCCSLNVEKLKSTTTKTKLILILPSHFTDDIASIIRSNIGAILTEKEIQSVLPIAIQSVLNNIRYFSPEITLSLLQQTNSITQQLTERELEIALLISQGLKSSDISDKLFLSLSTVATHRKHIFKKLNVHSAKELTDLIINRV